MRAFYTNRSELENFIKANWPSIMELLITLYAWNVLMEGQTPSTDNGIILVIIEENPKERPTTIGFRK
jgi:hypothetical protein